MGGVIVKVIDEILAGKPNAAGLAIHWQCFGSNGQEKADYSRGVLERFTRRATKDWYIPANVGENPFVQGNCYIKSVADPRKITFFNDPHHMNFVEGFYSLDENLKSITVSIHLPVVADKIVVNHYYLKSKEEFTKKISYGSATRVNHKKKLNWFDLCDRNEEFDDGILHYRAERAKNFKPPDTARAAERLFAALTSNLSPTLVPTTPPQFYAGKMETFLTCRAVAALLKTRLIDDAPVKFFEEAAIKAILRTIASGGMSLADARLLLSELPDLLPLPYPAVKDLRGACLNIIPQLMNILIRIVGNNKNFVLYRDYVELDYLQRLLKIS